MSMIRGVFGKMLAFAALALFAGLAQAQIVSASGVGSVYCDDWRVQPEQRREAESRATVAAVEAYLADTSAARMKLFAARRDELARAMSRYVTQVVVLNENLDRKGKVYSVTVRADINSTLLQAEIDAGSATANTPQSERSLLALLFMARSQASVQSFDDKIYTRADAEVSRSAQHDYRERSSEGERIGATRVATDGSVQQSDDDKLRVSASTTTGGSTLSKADAVTWQVANASTINTAMTGVFAASGYEAVEAEYVEGESGGQLSIERVRSDFSTGSDLSAGVLRSTVAGVRTAGIPLLAVGTLDVGLRDTDPVSGNVRVFVTVTGKVLDVAGRFPKTVSSVGPVQFFGLGPNQTVAQNNALALAAERAAQIMVDELNLRGVR
jgi:hypothetical protein